MGPFGLAVGTVLAIAAGLAATAAHGADAPAETGLIAWWRFDEGAGAVAKDASGHGLDGTIRGPVAWIPGISGTALSFDGRSYVEVPFERRLAFAGGFTLQAFIRPGDYAPNTYKTIAEFGNSILLRLDSPPEGGQLSFFTFLSDNPEPRLQAGVPAIGKWHQVFAVWDGRRMQLWLDGVKRERERSGPLTPTETALRIGPNFVGAIDEAKLYDRALTEDEIWSQVPPKLSLTLKVPRPLFGIGERFRITCEVANAGGQSLEEGIVDLALPAGLELVGGTPRVTVPAVPRTAPQTLSWTVRARAPLAAEVTLAAGFKAVDPVVKVAKCVVGRAIPSGGGPLQQPALVTTNGDLVLGNRHLRLVFPTNEFGYGVYAIDVNQGGRWTRMALANCFSYLAVKHAAATERQFVYARGYQPLAAEAGQAGIEFHSQEEEARAHAGTGDSGFSSVRTTG